MSEQLGPAEFPIRPEEYPGGHSEESSLDGLQRPFGWTTVREPGALVRYWVEARDPEITDEVANDTRNSGEENIL